MIKKIKMEHEKMDTRILMYTKLACTAYGIDKPVLEETKLEFILKLTRLEKDPGPKSGEYKRYLRKVKKELIKMIVMISGKLSQDYNEASGFYAKTKESKDSEDILNAIEEISLYFEL